AICTTFAKSGAHVIVADQNGQAAEATARLIVSAGGAAETVQFDVTDEAGMAAAIAALCSAAAMEMLEYNVCISCAKDTKAPESSQFSKVLDANLVGMHTAIRAVLPGMREKGKGVILATSSAWAHRHLGYAHSFYAASKAGMEHFIRLIAQETAGYGI